MLGRYGENEAAGNGEAKSQKSSVKRANFVKKRKYDLLFFMETPVDFV